MRERQFRPRWWATVAMLVVVVACARLGVWQQGKAERKEAAQALLEQRGAARRVLLDAQATDAQRLHYAPVELVGTPDVAHQFFVDNRFSGDQAGYHVITPVKLQGSGAVVLVNRGWVPMQARHSDLPSVVTPSGLVHWAGTATVPSHQFFSLVKDAPINTELGPWPRLWQNLDHQRFASAVHQTVLPVVVLLDAGQPDGFGRDWVRPDDRHEKHWSYAYQWYGFAATFAVIWLVLSFVRRPGESHE